MRRPRVKEPFNSYSHLLGVVLSIIALVALIIKADGHPRQTIVFSIYGLSLVLLYAASTIFHGLHISERGEDILKRLDHVAIFFLIAGSYTPICLLTLRSGWGGTLCALVWCLAVLGAAVKIFFDHLPAWASATIYVGLGWMAVLALGPLTQALPARGLMWLFGGGIAYTLGAVIYALERPDPYPNVFGHHEIFHIFVLAGSALHFVFMAGYVV
jgi:hemolysin III